MKHTIITKNPNYALPGLVQIAATNFADGKVSARILTRIWGTKATRRRYRKLERKLTAREVQRTTGALASVLELLQLPGNCEPEDLRAIADYLLQNGHFRRGTLTRTETPLSLQKYGKLPLTWLTLLEKSYQDLATICPPPRKGSSGSNDLNIPKATIKTNASAEK